VCRSVDRTAIIDRVVPVLQGGHIVQEHTLVIEGKKKHYFDLIPVPAFYVGMVQCLIGKGCCVVSRSINWKKWDELGGQCISSEATLKDQCEPVSLDLWRLPRAFGCRRPAVVKSAIWERSWSWHWSWLMKIRVARSGWVVTAGVTSGLDEDTENLWKKLAWRSSVPQFSALWLIIIRRAPEVELVKTGGRWIRKHFRRMRWRCTV